MAREDLQRVERTYRRLGGRWAWNVLSFAGFQGWESRIRQRAVDRLELEPGNAVLDVACGRGSNFPYLWRVVGERGRILGLDYSPDMLAGAQEFVRRKGWTNIELVRGDAAEMGYRGEFDGAICTIAMTVIPRWEQALRRMVSAVRAGGSVVVVDGRLGSGIKRLGNLYARLFARVVAADPARDVPREFRRLVAAPREESMMMGAYYMLAGRAPHEND